MSVVENTCWVSSRRYRVGRTETQDTAARSHTFKPTDCTGFCTDCLHLVPTDGCWRERARKSNLLTSKKKLFVFFGFRGFRSGRGEMVCLPISPLPLVKSALFSIACPRSS